MKKTIFLVLAALLLVCASAGCIAVEERNYIADYKVQIYVDKETGVEYILIGLGPNYDGIAPRYNADGTLKINEEFRK